MTGVQTCALPISQLIEAGVKIYEYQPGFLHAKSFVCDDEIAVVGTINLDYRSLYLHFEDGVWIYKNDVIRDILEAVSYTHLDVYKRQERGLSFLEFNYMIMQSYDFYAVNR